MGAAAVRMTPVRAIATFVVSFCAAVYFAFPTAAVFTAAFAFVLVQCVRHDIARWTAWSMLLAAFGAEAMLPLTFELRFAALLLLFAPLVFYCGSVLRAI